MRTEILRTTHPNGRMKQAVFVDGNKTITKTYFSNGQLEHQQTYVNGVLREDNIYTKSFGLVVTELYTQQGKFNGWINYRALGIKGIRI